MQNGQQRPAQRDGIDGVLASGVEAVKHRRHDQIRRYSRQ